MKKAIFIGLLLLIIAIAGGVYYVLSNLDSLVKAAIEKFGSEAVKTSVTVDSVNIKLEKGSAAINGLVIGNPAGFSFPSAFSLGEIGVDLDLDKISQENIAIKQINVLAPEVFYEINKERKGNLNVLKSNLSSGASGSSSSTSTSTESTGGKPVQLEIGKFVFKDAALKAKIAPLNDKEYNLKLPPLVLSNLKGTPEQISRQVLNQLIDHAKKEIKRKGLDQELEELKAKAKAEVDAKKSELKEKADTKLDAEKERAKDKLKNLLGN